MLPAIKIITVGYFFIVMLNMMVNVDADYEQTCTMSDYLGRRGRYVTVCGNRLADAVLRRCGGNVYMGPDSNNMYGKRRKRDIFLGKETANTYLSRSKRSTTNSMNQGIVCECCINRCTYREMTQYCQTPPRRNRSIRSLVTGKPEPKLITEQDVDEIYAELEKESKTLLIEPYNRLTIYREEYEKILQLEANKNKLIEEKYSQVLNVVDKPVIRNVDSIKSAFQVIDKPLDNPPKPPAQVESRKHRHRHRHSETSR